MSDIDGPYVPPTSPITPYCTDNCQGYTCKYHYGETVDPDLTPPTDSQGLEGEDEATYYDPRSFGKTSKQLMDFYIQCRKKVAIVLATPDGNIYSQKAHDNALTKAKEQAQLELLKLVISDIDFMQRWGKTDLVELKQKMTNRIELITQERERIDVDKPRTFTVGGHKVEFEHTAVNNTMHMFIDGTHHPELCPECIKPGVLS